MWPFRRKASSDDVPSFDVDNTIGPGTSVRGDIKSPGGIRVDGVVDGALDAEGAVVVGERGEVLGTVRAAQVIVLGTVRGDVETSGHLEIGPSGAVDGDVSVASLRVHTGGVFRGTSRMRGAEERLDGAKITRALPAPEESGARITERGDDAKPALTDGKRRSATLSPPADGAVPPPPGMRDLPPLAPQSGPVVLKSQERLVSAEPEGETKVASG